MKILKRIELLLLMATAIIGCSAPPGQKTVGVMPLNATVPPAIPSKSCVERSAAALPPKHPVVELVWCIAETDAIYDPDHLFRKTLEIKKFTMSEIAAGGVRASADGEYNTHLPKGINSLNFTRRNPKGTEEQGNRNFYIEMNSHDVCVTMADVNATFGEDWWLSPLPVVAPISAVSGTLPLLVNKNSNPYGIFFKSPKLFMGDVTGSVDFEFEYQKCVRHMSIQRRLDLIEYREFQQRAKMTTTPSITFEWLKNKDNKFGAYEVSADALALINKSEALKADMRAYAVSDYTSPARINDTAGLGQYKTYDANGELTSERLGYLDVAADHFSTPEKTVHILAHELGHFRVEEPGAVIANACANAWCAQDKLAYENACNLTEGYARLNEVRIGNELVEATRAQAVAEHRQLTVREQIFVDR